MTVDARKPLLGSEGLRSDSRLPRHVRPAFLRIGAVSAAAGSAYAEFGSTKVIVSVSQMGDRRICVSCDKRLEWQKYGPRESKKAQAFSDTGRLNCDVKFTSFATDSRGQAGQEVGEKEYSGLLHKALECAIDLHSFPKTTVDVFALIIQSDGGDLPAVITCASLALADAGIVMYDLVGAISGSIVGRELLLDSTAEEERSQDGSVLVAAMTSRNEITQVAFTGEWSSTGANEALELCMDACKKLGDVMRLCLKEDAAEKKYG